MDGITTDPKKRDRKRHFEMSLTETQGFRQITLIRSLLVSMKGVTLINIPLSKVPYLSVSNNSPHGS